ncbi:MAG: hypothetical protein GX802_08060 [Clostridiales bacterium]|nr:hypothetical protein [Clostridiales bacterium]
MSKPPDKKSVISLIILISLVGFCIYAIVARTLSLSPALNPSETTTPVMNEDYAPTVNEFINSIKTVNGSLIKTVSELEYTLLLTNDTQGNMTLTTNGYSISLILIEYSTPIKPEKSNNSFPIYGELYEIELKEYNNACDEICNSVKTILTAFRKNNQIQSADEIKLGLAIKDAIEEKSNATLVIDGVSIKIKCNDGLRIVIE